MRWQWGETRSMGAKVAERFLPEKLAYIICRYFYRGLLFRFID